jgi:preprotein translocase subunit SecG
MTLFLTVLHVMVCIFLIIVVLLQRGKGAEVGAMFGGGGSSTMFGARGAGNLFTKLTAVSAAVFMVTSFVLATSKSGESDLFDTPAGTESGFEEAAPSTSPFEAVDEPGFEEVIPEAVSPDVEEPATTEPAAEAPALPEAAEGESTETTSSDPGSTPTP